jgi:hypothetical protein
MKKLLLLPLLFAVGFAGAFAVTNAVDDDSTETVASTAGDAGETSSPEPVAVLAPIAVDVDPAAFDARPDDTVDRGALTEPIVPAGVSVSPTVSVRRALPVDAPLDIDETDVMRALAPELERDAGRPMPDPDSDPASGDDLGVGLFVDPCAGETPDDASRDGECADGVSSTVLAIRSPAAMAAVLFVEPAHVDASHPGWRRCDYPSGDGVPAVIVTNNPITEGFVSLHDVYDIAATRTRFDLEPTSDVELRRWERASVYPADWWLGPQHCVRVPITGARGSQWAITAHVSGVGGEDYDAKGWTVPDDRTRPPVSITFDGANHVRVVAPVQSNGMFVGASTIAFGPEGTGSCATHETTVPDAVLDAASDRRVFPEERLDADRLAADDYPYLPAYDALKQLVLELDEGTSYHLCLKWYRQDASFDDPTIIEREARFVSMPDRRRATFRVVGHEFVRPVNADSIGLSIVAPDTSNPLSLERRNPDSGACSAALPDGSSFRGGSRSVLATPVVLCATEGHVDDLLSYPEIDVLTQVRDADRQRVRIPLDLKSEGARSELYRIPLTSERRLCGSGPFGGGCGGTRDDFGAITLEVVYDEGRRNDLYDGFVGNAMTWTGPAPTRPESSESVQLDHFDDLVTNDAGDVVGIRPRTYTVPTEGRTDAIELHVRADRNATASVEVVPFTGRELCLRSGDGTATGAITARRDSVVRVTGLCARTAYFLRVELVDADGRATVFDPFGTSGWNSATTNGWQAEWSVNVYIEAYPGSDNIAMLDGNVVVDARPVDLRAEGVSAHETHNRCFAGRNRYVHRGGHRGFYGDEVTFDVRIALGDYVDPVSRYWRENFAECVHFGTRAPRFNVVEESLVVTTEELFAGRFTRVLDDGNGLRIVVHIDTRTRSVGSGYGYPDDRWRRG